MLHWVIAMRVGIAPSGLEIDGAYGAVFNARWSYFVRSDEYSGKWLGMGVLDVAPGQQPHLWSEAQADVPYDPEEPWEGDEVPGVSGKLVMAVLSSQKGWPYMLFSADDVQKEKVKSLTEYDAACDAYIRRENLRVWHIVEKNIDEWLRDRGYVHPFIVIGTPGIGKSFATGSLLLYQLLHYPSDDLKVVAYFVEGKAYIFHREERRVVYYEEQQVALRNVSDMIRRGVKGYIIFDISENSVHIGDLPYPWGIVLISSPNVKKYHEFTKRRQDTLPIYMNCYEDAEFKAALVWEKHLQVVNNRIRFEDVNLENDWKVLKKRIDMVGPLPRYVLAGQATYEKRVSEVETALRLMRDELGYYMRVLDNPHEWHEDGTTHKLVKLVRCEVKGKFECRNRVTSIYVLKELARKLRAAHLKVNLTYHILCGALEKCAVLLEELSLDIFTLREAVDTLVKHLEHLPRGNEAKRESVLCQRGANGRVPTALSEFASDSPRQKLVTGRIYKPLATNFPLVDGFFVVEGVGLKTIVLVQVTKAKEHHTKKTTVNAFREYMGKVFEDWENIEKAYTWELIYVQHVDSTAIKKRQNCSSPGDAANDTDLALWDRIHQYQVTLNRDIASEFINPSGGTRMA
ncbi:Variant surface glycoprotein [Trypanosoma congolense IL3000]|uniref:Variant surface glycoprotein n=1 Tax=Trypanosoma congolense (strain IL3000) TaxID=1068625 RepID=F9WG24_TRYCI|nr:Variant surface glycoprotein [Trypanosoma congolense IL3000]